MSNQWKMVPVEPTDEMRSEIPTGLHVPYIVRVYQSMLAAAPVPPAGDVEVVVYACGPANRRSYIEPGNAFLGWHAHDATPLVDRAHVTRLTAELERSQAGGQLLVRDRDQLTAERDGLLAEVAQQKEISKAYIASDGERSLSEHALRAELTKARELLAIVSKSCHPQHGKLIANLLAHQSAPAAKECDYCGGDGYHAVPRTPGVTCDACKGTGKDDAPAAKGGE